jgi:hypothetical protein
VHNERKQDAGQDYHEHPEEEHDDAGDGMPRYRRLIGRSMRAR